MSLLDPIAGDPLTPEGAFAQAANRETPFGEYLSAELAGGWGATRPVQAGTQALMPAPADYPTDEMRTFGPPGSTLPTTSPRLDKQAYEASPHFREGMPWDEGMTEARASALAAKHDADTYRASVIARYQGGFLGHAAGFVAGAAPGLIDPTNFVPVLGEAAQAAMVARLGNILGHGLTAAGDAAANTAMFEFTNAASARQIGQDFGVRDVATDILGNALAGSLFGLGKGWLHDRAATREALLRTGAKGLPRQADAVNLVAAQLDAGLPADVAPVLRGAPEMREPVAPPQPPPGIDAWHGGPHEFDRFALDKIGTGEGAQAFGHGLYFAENRKVAEGYRDDLTANKEPTSPLGLANRTMAADGIKGDAEAAIAELQSRADRANMPEFKKKAEDAIALIREGKAGGALYKVRLAVDKERLLDWDKPLSEQPAPVREALDKLGLAKKDTSHLRAEEYDTGSETLGKRWRVVGESGRSVDGRPYKTKEAADAAIAESAQIDPSRAGFMFYEDLKRKLGAAEASRALHEQGIHGIQYLDANSRDGAKAEPSRNYVVFDETRVHALERNGQPLDWSKGTPFEPHPSVAEAADRVGKDTPELETYKKDAGLEGYDKPLPGHEPPEVKAKLAAKAAKEAEKAGSHAVVGFKTAKGSTYAVDGERTTRTKTPHQGHDPKDVGVKKPSEVTYYIDPEDAARAGMHGSLSGEKAVVVRGDKAYLVSRVDASKPWGVAPSDKPIPLSTTPEVGKAPLELWKGRDGAQGRFFGEWHPGNEIVETHIALDRGEKAKAAGIEPPAPGPPPGEPDLPPELADIERMRRAGELPEGADAALGKAEAAARALEDEAMAAETLVGCVMRNALPEAASAAAGGLNWQDAMDRLVAGGGPGLDAGPLTALGRANRFAYRKGRIPMARGGGAVADVGTGG